MQPSSNAMNMAQQMMPQAAPPLPSMPTQGLNIGALLQQVQQLQQGGYNARPWQFALPGQLNTTHGTPISGASPGRPTGAGVRGGLNEPTMWGQGAPQGPPKPAAQSIHEQLAGMNPAQALHTLGRAKLVAQTMQHLRMLRQADPITA
jgi:hypothetical protein